MKKHIKWFVCVLVLLMGCSPEESTVATIPAESVPILTKHVIPRDTGYFTVEEDIYTVVCAYGVQDEVVYSLVLVFPSDQHYFPFFPHFVSTVGGNEFVNAVGDSKGRIYQQIGWTRDSYGIIASSGGRDSRADDDEGKVANADFGYVYFLDAGEIIFKKSNEDLGIDLSDSQKAFDRIHLLPILEKLVREYVKPQEPENNLRVCPTKGGLFSFQPK